MSETTQCSSHVQQSANRAPIFEPYGSSSKRRRRGALVAPQENSIMELAIAEGFKFFNAHPTILIVLLVVGVVFGFPLPKRSTKKNAEGETETTWTWTGGMPGIARGFVEIGRGLVALSQTLATERIAREKAHNAELVAVKAALDGVRTDQAQTNQRIDATVTAIQALTTQVRDLAQGVVAIVARHTSDIPPAISTAPTSLEQMRQSHSGA
jgi:hypothetical protein